MSSPIIRDTSGSEEGGTGEPMNELGVDPTTDPELYMALQLSLQEERNRQAQQVVVVEVIVDCLISLVVPFHCPT